MLELENICFDVCTDGKTKQILKNINLKINQKFVVITGPNGSGKSTLAKIIMGIEKPTSGNSSKGAKVLVHIGSFKSMDEQSSNPGSYSQSKFESN